MIDLKPISERKASATEITRPAAPESRQRFPASRCSARRARTCRSARKVSKTQYQYTLQDPDVAELFKWAPIVLAKLSALPELQDVTGDLQASAPRMMLKIDRDVIGRLGITPQSIDDTLYDAFGQRQVATIFGQLDQHRVILEVDAELPGGCVIAAKLYVRSTTTGQMVPLSALDPQRESRSSPLTINHQDQFPSVTLSFNLAPGHSLGDALAAIQSMEKSLAKPATLTARFRARPRSSNRLWPRQPYLIAAAIIAVYIVLGMLYESFIHPITILSTLPSAGVGAFAGADGAPLRFLADRADRRDPAGRHRQEERHHDDRLRPGRRTQAPADPGGSRSTRPACCASVRS